MQTGTGQDYAGSYVSLAIWSASPDCVRTKPANRANLLSFPLDRARRLRRHVVDDPVDAAHLVDDARGGAAEEVHVEGVEIRGHAVDRRDGAQRADVVVGPSVAHHADRPHRQQHREGLPDVVVEAGAADFLEVDLVGEAQDVALVAGDLAGNADGEARTWEGMAADEGLGQPELTAEHADLVLEQLPQRLDELHVHALGQPAHIVVRLDRHRGPAGERDALDDVGIERALGQELRAADRLGFGLEDLDEEPADGLALDLGVGDAGEAPRNFSAASTCTSGML